MSKVYNTKLNKSIIATILVVVFTVMIILIPFNTVYAAEDNGVVVTDSEISFGDNTIPRLIRSNFPIYNDYYVASYYDRLGTFMFRFIESDTSKFAYIYVPSKNIVIYVSNCILGLVNNGFTYDYSGYGYCVFYIYDLNNNVLSCLYSWDSVLSSNIRNERFYKYTITVNNGYYVSSSPELCYPFSGIDFLHDTQILYANYRINGFYEPDDSVYDLPGSILSYQYLFYRPEYGYVFIDSGEKLSDLDTSLTNVNGSGSFTSSFWIRWSEGFNKLVYKSIDGLHWELLNGSDVYGTYYNITDSVVRGVLGIPSGNSVSVWSYFQNTPNIPEDLVMTEFTSGDPIGQTIEFDSGSGEYTSGSSISDIVHSYSANANYTPNCYLAYTDYVPDLTSFGTLPTDVLDQLSQVAFQIDCEHSWPNYSQMLTDLFLNDHVYLCQGVSGGGNIFNFYVTGNEPSVGDQFTCWSYLTLRSSVEANVAVFSLGAAAYHKFPHYITIEFVESVNSPALFFRVLLDSLNGINNNILNFDSNVQTGFTNLTSQLRSLFVSSELGNTYLFDIKKALTDLAAAGGPDLTGVEAKLDQIISGFGSGASELLPADNEDSPLNPIYNKVNSLVTGLGLNNAEGVGLLALLTNIAANVSDIADSLDDDNLEQVGSAVTSFGSSSTALAGMFATLTAGIASLGSGMELFSGTASSVYDTFPPGLKILVIAGPTFVLATGFMYGARKVYGGSNG